MTSLEPIPPGWPRLREARLDLPRVTVEPRWEYKAIVREVSGTLLSEADLNRLGAEFWELVGVVSIGDLVHYYLKRERAI